MWLLSYLPQPSSQKALQDSQRRGTSLPPAHLLTIDLKDIAATCLLMLGENATFCRRLGMAFLFRIRHTMTLPAGLPPGQRHGASLH